MTTLVTRFTNCSKLIAETFAKMMIEDMIEAKKQYDHIWYDIEYANFRSYIERQKEITLKVATDYAEKRWKTERKRNEYINKQMNALVETPFNYRSISFYDFDVEPWKDSIDQDCILSYNNMTENAMIKCFNKIKDNKYFKGATGWVLEDHHNSRPQITLILNDELAKDVKEKKEALHRAVNNFYKGCTYYGD